ncbi:copper chaperone PCu(A)C [Vineibacter terrae]|uniref:Copper chaperone PCu(A)C n=2 Tax=Vineibacter terrae TaxID=2586908 RepID=A0A5C8PLJ6_9HYPH|nr:copper chaperone PCu(A)C [Vineibacter terrae]
MSIMSRFRAAGLAALLVVPTVAWAQDVTRGDLKIAKPWARETARMARAGGAFMTIENTGSTPDKLLKASSPAAARTEVHTVIQDGDVMRMREVSALDLAPKSKVELKPGGYHVMLMDLKAPLKAGDRFPMTLTFEKAGEVTVDIVVEKMSGPAPDHDKMKH